MNKVCQYHICMEIIKRTSVGVLDRVQHGLSADDLLYPFDRQFWYDNYTDLLQSRPMDPHSVTYQELEYVEIFSISYVLGIALFRYEHDQCQPFTFRTVRYFVTNTIVRFMRIVTRINS
jgi:hypothetical protein